MGEAGQADFFGGGHGFEHVSDGSDDPVPLALTAATGIGRPQPALAARNWRKWGMAAGRRAWNNGETGARMPKHRATDTEEAPPPVSTLLQAPALCPSPEAPSTSRPPRRVAVTLRWGVFGLVAFLVAGNLVIAGASVWARRTTSAHPAPALAGVRNLRVVDDHLWRGAAPSRRGYAALAAAGVRTVVDLRAETDLNIDEELLGHLGLERLAIPMRDGQAPTDAEIEQFLAVVQAGPGPTFVHCGAGVGRTGTMVAAYLVANRQSDEWTAMRRNLAVGPPSLEQLAFVAGLDDGDRPPSLLVAASRVLDAPRRLWSRLRA